MIAAKGFAIQKVLKDGKLIKEKGIMGEFDNKQGAKIVEVSDGKAKYTELTPSDIMKLISRPSSSESLEHRLASLTRKHHHRRHHRHHHSRGVASGHRTKRQRHRRRHKKRRTHKHKRHHKRHYTRRHRRRRRN